MGGFNETALLLGRAKSLVGVATLPGAGTRPRRPAVIFVNSGIVHRVGHHRMYVRLARLLAAAGHPALRFDLSGLGDSAGRSGVATESAWHTDIAEAIDDLSALGEVDRVVLVGLCAGADLIVRYAHTDERVVGIVLLDPTIPPTARFYVHYIARRMRRLRSWLSFARGRGRLWNELLEQVRFALGGSRNAPSTSAADPRNRRQFEHFYGASVSCGIRLLIVLTGGAWEGRQSYREQLLEALPNVDFGDTLSLVHLEECDHTFSSVGDRKRLNELITGWIGSTTFGRADARE
jgi:pimeloyl-ACP methyl ester carboxylesterase